MIKRGIFVFIVCSYTILFLEYAWKTIAKIATDVIEKMDILVSLNFDFRPSNNLISSL